MHKDGKIYKEYNGNVFAWFVRDLFYPDDTQGWNNINNGLFEAPDYKKFLENYFKINLDNIEK